MCLPIFSGSLSRAVQTTRSRPVSVEKARISSFCLNYRAVSTALTQLSFLQNAMP